MVGNDELKQQIITLVEQGVQQAQRNKGQTFALYRLAFPLAAPEDETCSGCFTKVWGKLERLYSTNFKNLTTSMEKTEEKKTGCDYTFAPEFKGQILNFPKLRIFGVTEANLTNEVAEAVIASGSVKHMIVKKK